MLRDRKRHFKKMLTNKSTAGLAILKIDNIGFKLKMKKKRLIIE